MIYEHNDHGLRRAIGYDAHGEGPAVVLLHPFPFDRSHWHAISLAGFRVIAVDARGYGDSALGEAGYTIDDLGDDVVALLDHLGVPMAALAGSSMGGYVALSVCARRAARVSALALVGTRAAADGDAARLNRDAAIAQIHAHGVGTLLDGVGRRLCGASADAAIVQEAQRQAVASSSVAARALPATLVALRDRPDRSALLSTLRLPALVVVGDEDAVTPADEGRAMHAAIPGARIVLLPGCGHLSAIERPAALTDALQAFLAGALQAP